MPWWQVPDQLNTLLLFRAANSGLLILQKNKSRQREYDPAMGNSGLFSALHSRL
jgi:hypothetical protein